MFICCRLTPFSKKSIVMLQSIKSSKVTTRNKYSMSRTFHCDERLQDSGGLGHKNRPISMQHTLLLDDNLSHCSVRGSETDRHSLT